MASIFSFGLFDNKCAGCKKSIRSFAMNRTGSLPRVFCNSVCQTKAERESRVLKNIVDHPRFRAR